MLSPKVFPILAASLVGALVTTAPPAKALSFNLSLDPSVGGAPAGFVTDFNSVVQFYQTQYTDPITINLHVGWGEINGNPLAPGNLGQSSTNQQGFYTYNQVRTALINDASSPSDTAAINSLPGADPFGCGACFVMSNAEAKALGLLAGNAAGIDGWVGFNSSATYTFDPVNRAVPGAFDFYGLASHEITEIMGRYGLSQNGAASGRYSPIDLFRYLGIGTRDFTPANGSYFSIDGGVTNINTFNGTGGGDLSDWAGIGPDSYNHSLNTNTLETISAGDLTLMDVIGYDAAAASVPEPSTVFLFAASFLVCAGGAFRHKSRVESSAKGD
jgi:hypothetical protein